MPKPEPPLSAYRHPRKPTGGVSAFTLIELLVVLAILTVLALLVMTLAGKAREQSQAASCIQNLRLLGTAFQAYANDHRQTLYLSIEKFGSGSSVQWMRYLLGLTDGQNNRGNNGMVYLSQPGAGVCPSFAPFRYKPTPSDTVGYTYGAITRDKNDPYAIPLPDGKASSRVIHLSKLDAPASYWLLTDSYTTSLRRQLYTISPTDNARAVHFRHGDRANVLYADGHIEALTFKEFSNFQYNAITFGYDRNQNLIESR